MWLTSNRLILTFSIRCVHYFILTPILTHLPPREQQVLQALYDEGRTQREVAEQLGMSQMMVSKIHRQAIQHIRERLLS
ncbi:sigma-70 family RNA polymerase sigma factor [Alicyclobacillus tolerans]|uniref:sigma-70 family RNA polymerase sigma factor n=1 Tax=Alicyclobacillus tolerans TaxID=90970 RepID=UPI003B7713A5